MRKIFSLLLITVILLTLAACQKPSESNESVNKKKETSTPEEVAAINVESWFEHDFEAMLETYPTFRLRKRASYYVDESEDKMDIKIVAQAMHAYYDSDKREVEILSSQVTEQQKFTDFTMYNELKEEYEDLTMDEFKKITDIATVKVDYSLTKGTNVVALDDELKCIKMDEKWYVLSDGAFAN